MAKSGRERFSHPDSTNKGHFPQWGYFQSLEREVDVFFYFLVFSVDFEKVNKTV